MAFGVIGKEQVVDRWDTLISGADGLGNAVMDDTERLLAESKAPDAKSYRKAVSPSVMHGIMGGKRPFLIVANTSNSNLKPYKMYINTRDYGVNLQISWYLVFQPSFWQKLVGFLLRIPILGLVLLPGYAIGKAVSSKEAGVFELNLFDEMDLRAYVTNAHHCLLESVEKLSKAKGIEPPKMDKQSQGFLGIN